MLLGAIAWLFFSIRASYYAKVSVTEAARFADQVADAMNVYYEQHQAFPPAMSALPLPHGEPGYVPNVTLDPALGVLTVDVTSREGAFGALRYVSERSTDGQLKWRCESVSVSQEFLPPQCAPSSTQ